MKGNHECLRMTACISLTYDFYILLRFRTNPPVLVGDIEGFPKH